MTFIITPGALECPLCFKQMREVLSPKGRFYVCLDEKCMISINASDSACGKWRDNLDAWKDVTCPRDGAQMRVFFRIKDGFIKAQCPICRKQGRITQVVKGRVEDYDPNTPWSFDPEQE